MKRILLGLCVTALTLSTAVANEIYVNQIGDNLDLDVTQDGQNNQFGDSGSDVILSGDDMTFSISQIGDSNDISAVIKGANYTGTWAFTGDLNTVDLACSSVATGNCETVTLNITTTGDSNQFSFDIGETSDADSATVAFTVTGDNSVIDSSIDGQSAALTVIVDNSTSLATTSVNSDEGNAITTSQSGDGDVVGHTLSLDITGGGSTYNVTQSGIYDASVTATFNGDSQDVDITQSD